MVCLHCFKQILSWSEAGKQQKKKKKKLKFDSTYILPLRSNLQSFTKYLRQTLVPCEIARYGKSSISDFLEIFASTEKTFISGGGLSTRQ